MEFHLPEAPENTDKYFHPGFAVSCVVFRYEGNRLKVLLCQNLNSSNLWYLPSSGMSTTETAEAAAARVLWYYLGLDNIYFNQFYLFSDLYREFDEINEQMFGMIGSKFQQEQPFYKRYISLGFYALINFESFQKIKTLYTSSKVGWFDTDKLPEIAKDQKQIVDKSIEVLRYRFYQEPVELNLLPDKFTMPELKCLYEIILGVQLDRRNFYKKLMRCDILINTYEQRKGGGHKAPFLYKIKEENYHRALQNSLRRW